MDSEREGESGEEWEILKKIEWFCIILAEERP